ncbi:hypothetical protein GCM10007937_46250 [Mesorhizobium albiziae]|nr:hypothetical protein GCM10007937_46250 [Mesorhizobium albiziae]
MGSGGLDVRRRWEREHFAAREAAARFIDTLLSSNLSKEELTAIWAKAGSDWCVSEPQVVSFLEQLRDALRLETNR